MSRTHAPSTAKPIYNLQIRLAQAASLKPAERNPRTHARRQIEQIASSIRQFGFTHPILVDAQGCVIAGHARLQAAQLLGLEQVPTIRLDHLSEAEKRGYLIADNRLAENAGWDQGLLALELSSLLELDLDFDLTVTGFETAEIDLLIQGPDQGATDDAADQIPGIDPSTPSVSRSGDLWILGRHRLICADATKAPAYERLLNGKKAQMVFADPPYNVPIHGHVSGRGSVKHCEFPMASGEMSQEMFVLFLTAVFSNLVAHSSNGSIHFICIDWRHLREIQSAAQEVFAELKNVCVWAKNNGGLGSLYRSQHELIFVFKNGDCPHINNVNLGRFGRNRTNVWNYPGVSSFRSGRLAELAMHPTVKPVALVADAILDCSRRNGIVLDSFGGSGTTLIAAEQTGRRAYLMELEPKYIDVTIERFQKFTRERVVHAVTGVTFEEMQQQRATQGCASTAPTGPWRNSDV
jgi:DNA modification methylase